MENYSVGMNMNPESSATFIYLQGFWNEMNALNRKTMGELSRSYAFSGPGFQSIDPYSGFKAHTIKVTFSINLSGQITILKMEHPEDTPRRQLRFVEKLILQTAKQAPTFPSSLITEGKKSIEDTIIFNFT